MSKNKQIEFLTEENSKNIKMWRTKGFTTKKGNIAEIVKNHKKIFNNIMRHDGYKPSTKKKHIAVLSKLMRLYDKPDEHKFYTEVIENLVLK